jgi:hypothetical protein
MVFQTYYTGADFSVMSSVLVTVITNLLKGRNTMMSFSIVKKMATFATEGTNIFLAFFQIQG